MTAAGRLPENRAIEHCRCVCSPIRVCHVRRDHPLHVHIVQRPHMLAVTFLLPSLWMQQLADMRAARSCSIHIWPITWTQAVQPACTSLTYPSAHSAFTERVRT